LRATSVKAALKTLVKWLPDLLQESRTVAIEVLVMSCQGMLMRPTQQQIFAG